MSDKEQDPMPGKQSDQEGTNAPDPGTMPEEYIDDGAGNRMGPTPDPTDEEPQEEDFNRAPE